MASARSAADAKPGYAAAIRRTPAATTVKRDREQPPSTTFTGIFLFSRMGRLF
jgi:hypothetical protein